MEKKEKVLAISSLIYIIGLFAFLLMLFLCIVLDVEGVANLVLIFLAFLFIGYIVIAIIRMYTYIYKCPKCGQLNKMNFFQVLFSRRGDNTRKLKCTKCNEIAYMERQVR